MKTRRTKNTAVSWAILLLMLWLGSVGTGTPLAFRCVAPVRGVLGTSFAAKVLARSLAPLLKTPSCPMCKNGRKCCCVRGKGGTCCMSARCDGDASPNTTFAGSRLPLLILPPTAAKTPAAFPTLFASPFAQAASHAAYGRTPTPPHAPPQPLS